MEKTAAVCTSLLVLVFGYTALSKLANPAAFRMVLERVPYLKTGAAVLSVLLPLAELFIVLLLLFPATRLKGLYGSLALLLVFTVYLVWMLVSGVHLPCSCGGVIGKLSWKAHVGLNLGLIGLTVVGVRRYKL